MTADALMFLEHAALNGLTI
ncbi:hypothetical protein DVH24_040875 [Malus domestica]|uniref:Uncharacterized protein n=1 Tax=Malus domestica TaxID=3750 RepID=A0A498I7L1_MALDO|nr:hypothetical protein DVH24_040875 [Malus domestica]